MAAEVTAWRIDRRQKHEDRRRAKIPLPPAVDPASQTCKGAVVAQVEGEEVALYPRSDGAWTSSAGEVVAAVDAWAWSRRPEDDDAFWAAARARKRSGQPLTVEPRKGVRESGIAD